jgi:ApaG protein
MFVYSEKTHDIQVDVVPRYLGLHASDQGEQHVFAYQVTVSNSGPKAVQLLSRHWIITDGEGRVEEVKGPGVVGEQPVIPPGEKHTYESFCPLPTPTGNMRGSYQMAGANEVAFDIKIPLFFLRPDYVLH